jgi:hypothetical protein
VLSTNETAEANHIPVRVGDGALPLPVVLVAGAVDFDVCLSPLSATFAGTGRSLLRPSPTTTSLDEIEAIVEATEGGHALMLRFDQASADRSLERQDAAVREHCARIRALLDPVTPPLSDLTDFTESAFAAPLWWGRFAWTAMGRQLSGADDWGLTRQGPAVGFAKRTARVLRTRNSPVTFPRGGVVSRPGRSSTYPRLSPATPWAYAGHTHVSHESGCARAAPIRRGALLRDRAGATGRPIPGAL